MNTNDIEDIYELSPAQQGMYFHTLMGKSPEIMVEQFICEFDQTLNPGSLKRACEQVVARHTALRTSFHTGDLDKPLQVVERRCALPWQELDWRSSQAASFDSRLEALLDEDRKRGFDTSQAPLMRFFLISRPDGGHQFVWSHHHLLLDGWSLPVVMGEILTCYDAQVKGKQTALAPAQPYREYIAYLQSRRSDAAENYWRSRIGSFAAATALGNGRTLSSDDDHIREIGFRLSDELARDLQTLAREQRVTASVVFQALWALVLGAHSGDDEVLFGMTVSGRPAELSQLSSCVGLFINTLPVPMQLKRDMPMLALLRLAQSERLEMHEYEHTPLVDIHQWSQLPQGKPLFHSLLVFENFPQQLSVDTLVVRDVRIHGGKTPYPLTIIVDPEHGFSLRLLYHRDVIDDAVAQAFAQAISHLMERVLANPEAGLGELMDSIVLPKAARLVAAEPSSESAIEASKTGDKNGPRTAVEQSLWQIWTDLLGTEDVGIDDDFFELGGHSLLATQAISRIRMAFGTDVPLKVLFTSGHTIAELASAIEEHLIANVDDEELAGLYQELEHMSDEEAERLLAEG